MNRSVAREALERLRAGNRRFAAGERQADSFWDHPRRAELAQRQSPCAVVLGCSDSRVPVEIVFDQGLGDLFVIRVAGNVAAPTQIGSVEFAATKFGTRLVVVMGHSQCGAIAATVDELILPPETRSPNLRSLVERVRPAVQELLAKDRNLDLDILRQRAVRANVEQAVENLRHGSEILEHLIATDGMLVVGAEYSLTTGLVEFFDSADGEEPVEGD